MPKESIYFDNAATTPLCTDVAKYLGELQSSNFANPNSLHSMGRQSRKLIEEARKTLASRINAEAEELFFTSNATEANNLAIRGLIDDDSNWLIITSPSEHPCVLEPIKDLQINSGGKVSVHYLNLDNEGFIDLSELESTLKDKSGKNKILVSIMHGNNEIGTVQDIDAIGELCKKYKAYFHTDAVQTYGKLDIDVKKSNIDFLSSSGHKIHSPKGIGFLYKRKDIELKPLILGGGQESNMRSGTENMNSILAFAKAIEGYSKSNLERVRELEEKLLTGLKNIPGIIINGPEDTNKKVPGIINFSLAETNNGFSKFDSEQLVLQMDLAGFALSSGSACSNVKNNESDDFKIVSSYVLRSCRLPEHISKSSIRLSLSCLNTDSELESFLDLIRSKAQ